MSKTNEISTLSIEVLDQVTGGKLLEDARKGRRELPEDVARGVGPSHGGTFGVFNPPTVTFGSRR